MTSRAAPTAVLALEDGRIFRGRSVGHSGTVVGEVVFTTCMSGYQEVLSDPSYAGQIVSFTYPLIGNVGVNPVDEEAGQPHCRGVILRRLAARASSHRATGGLGDWLIAHRLVALEGIDTRALTRHIRQQGAMRGLLTSRAAESTRDFEGLIAAARDAPQMSGQDLTAGVACQELMRFTGTWAEKRFAPVAADTDPFAGGDGPRVLVLDFGVKQGILEGLVGAGARVVLAPGRLPANTIRELRPDGLLLSNGPGDPAAVGYGIETVRALIGELPILGICLGHQLLALALGLTTVKLPFGHHGANHPVQELASGRVLITSQNHGFAVRELPEARSEIQVTHVSLYDGTIEGLAVPARRLRSVQFHPEASPGPHDAHPILVQFVDELLAGLAAAERSAARSATQTGPTPCRRAVTSNAS